jgi:hypothetical protein
MTVAMAIARPSTPWHQPYLVTPEVAYLKEHLDTDNERMIMVYPFRGRDLASSITLLFDAQAYHGLNSANIYDSLVISDYFDFFADFGDVEERKQLAGRGYSQGTITDRATSPLMDALAVRFVIAAVPLSDPGPLIQRLQGANYTVYERPDPMPRAFFVSNAEVLEQDAIHDRLRQIARAEFTLQQLRRYVLLDRDTLPPAGLTTEVQTISHGESGRFVPARVVKDDYSRISIDVDAPSDGWLVLSDTFYPGWRATANGLPVPIVRANGFARAIPVRAGHQEVVFRYDPRSVRYGAWLTVVAVLVTVIVLRRRKFSLQTSIAGR